MKFLYKTLIISFFTIFFFGCNESNNYDEENIITINEATENEDTDSSNLDERTNIRGNITSSNTPLTLLALGDSYTIGEAVSEDQRWPNQFTIFANENGYNFMNPRIIAETGWKTSDLINAIESSSFEIKYDYVSLLIGVNNQFNSRPVDEFRNDLNKLLIKINNLKTKNGNVLIISIPDWGSSPFGVNFDRNKISNEINIFNNILKNFANINGLKYVDVTEISRRAIYQPALIADDNLHPSGIMYLEWVKKIYNIWID